MIVKNPDPTPQPPLPQDPWHNWEGARNLSFVQEARRPKDFKTRLAVKRDYRFIRIGRFK